MEIASSKLAARTETHFFDFPGRKFMQIQRVSNDQSLIARSRLNEDSLAARNHYNPRQRVQPSPTLGLVKIGVLATMLYICTSAGWGQIRLPGGINIPEPRQINKRGLPRLAPERPDLGRVCPMMVDWIQRLQNEYPGVDLAHTVVDRLQQMAVPLFADEVFEKQFGMSYSKLSDSERRDFFQSHIIPCRTSQQYVRQTIVLQGFGPAFQPGTLGVGPLSPGRLIPALERLGAARSTLQADEQALRAASPSAESYDLVSDLLNKRRDELGCVWPSEKKRFQGEVNGVITHSAAAALEAKLQPLLANPASPQAAKQLHDAPLTYSALLEAVPTEQQNALQTKLEERREAVIRELLPPQRARAESFPATREGLDNGAEWFGRYRAVFLEPPVSAEAATVAKAYLTHREAALAKMMPQFRQKIETSQEPDTIASMYDDVFRLLPDDRQTEAYRQLSSMRAARAELLTKRVVQAQLAAEEKEEKAAQLRGDIVASSLKVANLSNAKIFRAIYVGDFAHAGMARADVFFVDMFGGYLQDFGEKCNQSLPADKVMMTVNECVRSQHLVNRWGMQTSPDSCILWERHPIGVYADARAFAAKVSLEDVSQRNSFRIILAKMTKPEGAGSVIDQVGDMVGAELSVTQDLPKLIAENGCNSKALVRLQENMIRFATGEDPLRVAGFALDASKITRAQDLKVDALADDLIRANAAGWLMNQYTGLYGAELDRNLDAQGRARHIHATYDQKGVTSTGSVDIAFVDGMPACLYFADDPSNCKAPSPAVVSKYENGEYRKGNGR